MQHAGDSGAALRASYGTKGTVQPLKNGGSTIYVDRQRRDATRLVASVE